MLLPFEIFTNSPEETEKVGEDLALLLKSKTDLPNFVAMYGDLGVGKTAFVRGFTRPFVKDASVKSPTFALVNQYGSSKVGTPIYHFDMYRITDDDDLYSTGFYDYLNSKGICIAEWCENIPYALPDCFIKVVIEKISPSLPDRRKITVNYENL